MRFLFLGDMVGRSGRTAVYQKLPGLIAELKLDFVVVNGENAAGGFGITEEIFEETRRAGADVMTTGNHVWDQREALEFSTRHDRFLRPANYPIGAPGNGSGLFEAKNGARVLVANVMGRVFMNPDLDDPFRCAGEIVAARSSALGISSMVASVSSSAPTPTYRPPTIRSCPAAPLSSRTRACAATMTLPSAWRRKSR
jgi:calcineurin-like phosphoesterase